MAISLEEDTKNFLEMLKKEISVKNNSYKIKIIMTGTIDDPDDTKDSFIQTPVR